jgi:hypothetical protein
VNLLKIKKKLKWVKSELLLRMNLFFILLIFPFVVCYSKKDFNITGFGEFI